jgi:hypothetical protein
MDRLNSLQVAYIKEVPMETIPEIFFDTVVNEVNNNIDELNEIVLNQSEMLRINFLLMNFVSYTNNGGLEAYLNCEEIRLHEHLVSGLRTIGAPDTATLLASLTDYIPLKGDYFELEHGSDSFYLIQELEMSLRENEEPLMDFLINYDMETLRDMDDDDFI